MTSFRLTHAAVGDLEAILDHLAADSGAARAEAVRLDLLGAIHRLARNPGIGHRREDLTDRPVLFWSVHSWMIVYRRERTSIEVLRVISGWRDVGSVLKRS